MSTPEMMEDASPDRDVYSEIEYLRSRLEINDTGIDGIAARDATIRLLEAELAEAKMPNCLTCERLFWCQMTTRPTGVPVCIGGSAYLSKGFVRLYE
jgi:hypothetical protein